MRKNYVRVFKFGGASVRDAAAVRNMSAIIAAYGKERKPVVIVSAMGKTTNALEELVYNFRRRKNYKATLESIKAFHLNIMGELFKDAGDPVYELVENSFYKIQHVLDEADRKAPFDELYDSIVSFGELISTQIVSRYLLTKKIPCTWVDSRNYIRTDSTWREGKPDFDWTEKLIQRDIPELLKKSVVLTQGFIGGTAEGRTTTLGREGSDFSAAIYAYSLHADSMTVWKDVPGVLTADPKLLPKATKYEHLSYTDAAEMTYYGATVIHPKTIKPLANRHIPLFVRSFVHPEEPGTRIDTGKAKKLAPAIICKNDQRLLSLSGKDLSFIGEHNLSTIFRIFADLNIKINMMQSSAISFSVCIDNNLEKIAKLIETLEEEFDIKINEGLELITVKNYDVKTVAALTRGKTILLEQKDNTTFRAIVERK